jgi:hypothetical protein
MPADIRTEHLSNASLEVYCYINLLVVVYSETASAMCGEHNGRANPLPTLHLWDTP